MSGKKYKEVISIASFATSADGQGGITEGARTYLYENYLVWIQEKPLNPNYTDTTEFSNSQSFTMFYDSGTPVSVENLVEWRGKDLIIKSIEFLNDNRRITINTISR
jgi:hypothetical protein